MKQPAGRLALTAGLLALCFSAPDAAAATQRGGPPAAAFKVPARSVLEHAGLARLTVELPAPATRAVSVPFTVGGSATLSEDFEISASPLVIPAGQTFGAIIVTLLDDNQNENTETVEVVLGAPRGGTLGATTSFVLAIQDFRLGDPIEGLSVDERASFERGRAVFDRRFKPSEGLGPFYNATSCASCHSTPQSGGSSGLYRNFYLAVYYENTPSNQSSAIAPFLSQVVPAYGSGGFHAEATFQLDGGRPLIPETVFGLPVLSAQRNSIPVFGTGLFEFISDLTIRGNSDPNDTNQDNISGRVNTQLNGLAVGRFGTKAQVNNIELFTRGPLQNQMGITTDPLEGIEGIVSLSMLQVSANPNNPTVDDDGVPDPELGAQDLGDLIAFTRFLAPPLKQPFNDAALRGEQLFAEIGCTLCHIPSLPSSRGPVDAYTDLLLHDLGEDLADFIRLGDSFYSLEEFRTQPLWGIGAVGPYMHDGRAGTLRDAIEMHGGEAQFTRDDFSLLTEAEQGDVISFLEHL